MRLPETFGVWYSRTLGIGDCRGDSISFIFDHATGPFTNTFTWHPGNDDWTFDLTYREEGGLPTFATKRMRRAKPGVPGPLRLSRAVERQLWGLRHVWEARRCGLESRGEVLPPRPAVYEITESGLTAFAMIHKF